MTIKKIDILTVDDDPEVNTLLGHRFKTLNCDVRTTTTPDAFLAELEKKTPDLCLVDLDIGMPGAGMLLVRAIRTTLGPELPVIILSRHEDTDTTAHALEIGATDYITKPPTKERFLQTLSKYIALGDNALELQMLKNVPKRNSRAEVSFKLEVIGIDELGVQLRSQHLIARGSVFYLNSPELAEITGREGPLLLSMGRTEVDPGNAAESYRLFASFDPSDDELQRRVRSWLITSKSLKSKDK